MWKPYTSQSHLFYKTNLVQIIICQYAIHTTPMFVWKLETVRNTEILYNKKLSPLRKIYTRLTNIAIWNIIFQTQLNEYVVSKNILIFISTHFNHEISKQ